MDDTALYADVMGEAMTLNGSPVQAIFDSQSETVADEGVVTLTPAVTLAASAAPSAAVGQSLVRQAVTYTVRRVLRLPPDGAMLRLELTRA